MSGLKLPKGADLSSWLPARVTPLHVVTGIVWAATVLASMSALYSLAVTYGGWQSAVGVLFPCCLDLYWIAAIGVALDANLPSKARVAAAAHSGVAFALSACGQLLYHEMHASGKHGLKLSQIQHTQRGILIAAIGLTPAFAGLAMAHLNALHRRAAPGAVTVPAKPKRTMPPRQAATVPANRASRASDAEPDRASPTVPTVPQGADNRATGSGTVPDPTVPDRATGTVPPAEPTVPSGELPAPLKAGGRPDPIAIQGARDIWRAAVKAGRIHNDRSLTDAVNEHFGYKVIGRTSAGSVIAEESDARRRLA